MATNNYTSITAYAQNHTEIALNHTDSKNAFYRTVITIKFKERPKIQTLNSLQKIIEEYAQKHDAPAIELEDGAPIPIVDKYQPIKHVGNAYELISKGDGLRIRFDKKSDAEGAIFSDICHLFSGAKKD